MAATHFKPFHGQATVPGFHTGCPLTSDCPYAGMHRCGVDVHDTRLRMAGPAAAGYVPGSYPLTA
jgi:hypothetical protein